MKKPLIALVYLVFILIYLGSQFLASLYLHLGQSLRKCKRTARFHAPQGANRVWKARRKTSVNTKSNDCGIVVIREEYLSLVDSLHQ